MPQAPRQRGLALKVCGSRRQPRSAFGSPPVRGGRCDVPEYNRRLPARRDVACSGVSWCPLMTAATPLPRPTGPQVDRTPPQDVQAEQSVLGAMMMSKDAVANVVEVLKGRDFYR